MCEHDSQNESIKTHKVALKIFQGPYQICKAVFWMYSWGLLKRANFAQEGFMCPLQLQVLWRSITGCIIQVHERLNGRAKKLLLFWWIQTWEKLCKKECIHKKVVNTYLSDTVIIM